ncbi:hypothetical protein GCM10017581_079720 [Dactylosporangium matsuzakiense]|uniref:Uncharacterized protein n=1 Tax=Dactylosporangium matsuzakiense TaxID=53360 RepID=A0A9W6NR51_9ACTN|nr:hypothetical protein GCM10017581_079720 [Dactylosporangium matsuzakiense]
MLRVCRRADADAAGGCERPLARGCLTLSPTRGRGRACCGFCHGADGLRTGAASPCHRADCLRAGAAVPFRAGAAVPFRAGAAVPFRAGAAVPFRAGAAVALPSGSPRGRGMGNGAKRGLAGLAETVAGWMKWHHLNGYDPG